jgi:hypothetical protein
LVVLSVDLHGIASCTLGPALVFCPCLLTPISVAPGVTDLTVAPVAPQRQDDPPTLPGVDTREGWWGSPSCSSTGSDQREQPVEERGCQKQTTDVAGAGTVEPATVGEGDEPEGTTTIRRGWEAAGRPGRERSDRPRRIGGGDPRVGDPPTVTETTVSAEATGGFLCPRELDSRRRTLRRLCPFYSEAKNVIPSRRMTSNCL